MTRWIARLLAVGAVAWCVALGAWIWSTPLGTPPLSFAEISALGPVPLLIPLLISASGAWAVWRGRLLPATIAAGLLVVLVFLTGFSIGTGYAPAAGALVWAIVARADS